jgi:hypothetical protein
MEKHRVEILAKIQRLSREEGAAGSQVMENLKRDYNTTVEWMYNNTPGVFRDIIDVFPPEVWIRIIQESLPVQSYPSALLLLTMVSVKWQQAIIATPLLWSRIHISGLDEDALATMRVFAHLSRNTSLLLTIDVPLYYEPGVFDSILADLSTRLHRVVIKADGRILGRGYSIAFCDGHIASGIRTLLGSLQYCLGVVDIDVQHLYADHVIHADTALGVGTSVVPHSLHRMHGWCFCSLDSWASGGKLQHLEELQTCMPLEDSGHHLRLMPQLRTLLIVEGHETPIDRRKKTPNAPEVPNLTRLSIRQTDRATLVKFMESTGLNLLDLELIIPYEQCSDLLEVLKISTRLTRLSIRLVESDVGVYERSGHPRLRVHTGEPIPSLKTLELTAEHVDFTQDVRRSLLSTIGILYKSVEEAVISFDFVEGSFSLIWDYLSGLSHLKRLKLKGIGWVLASEDRMFVLSALEELDTAATEPLRWLRTPKLLSLQLPWDEVCDELGVFTYKSARSVRIRYDDMDTPSIRFLPGSLPAVTTLDIRASGGYIDVRPGPLRSLRTISITARADTPIASALCTALLYRPEECPALCEIKLLGFGPEWDILVMMLERRNFLRDGRVSRIRRITLQYVPNELRKPLAGLLRGVYTPRPSNEELSFVASMDVFFDDQM